MSATGRASQKYPRSSDPEVPSKQQYLGDTYAGLWLSVTSFQMIRSYRTFYEFFGNTIPSSRLLLPPNITFEQPIAIAQQRIRVPHRGGLLELEYLLGLRSKGLGYPPSDVVFVSIDLERGLIHDRGPAEIVKEIGIAKLDSRFLKSAAFPAEKPLSRFITTEQFSLTRSAKTKECLFSDTCFISPRDLGQTLLNALQIQDNADPPRLRNIVLVGQSCKNDLRVLLRLGVDFYKLAPTAAVLDTHDISRHVFGHDYHLAREAPPNITLRRRGYTLGNILDEFNVPFRPDDLHNAGNDATYTLYAMLMLAIRSSRERKLTADESENLKRLDGIVQMQLNALSR